MTINVPVTKMPSKNVFNELHVKITVLRAIPKKNLTACNAAYFRLCIDLMHITPPVTAEGRLVTAPDTPMRVRGICNGGQFRPV